MEGHASSAAGQPPLDTEGTFRRVFYVILGVVLLLFVIAATVPIDGGVAASGTIAVEYLKKPIQHPSGGFIKKVFVKEGESVRAGQPLAELVSADLTADFHSTSVREFSLLITRSRLRSELDFRQTFQLPAELQAEARKNETLSLILANEIRQFNSRREAFLNEQQTLQERAKKLLQEQETLQKLIAVRERIYAGAEADAEMRKKLLESGFISMTGSMEYQMKKEESLSKLLEERNNLKRIEREQVEIRFKLVQMQKDWRSQVMEKLVDVERDMAVSSSKTVAAQDKYNQLTLTSPTNGRVVNILVHDEGAVLNPGQVLMSVIPDDERRIVTARIPSHQIDGVVPGIHARLRFTGKSSVAVMDGIVENVSADKADDERTGTSFYTVRITVLDSDLKNSGVAIVMVGMPVEVLLTLESRTFFGYLVKPLKKFFDHAVRER